MGQVCGWCCERGSHGVHILHALSHTQFTREYAHTLSASMSFFLRLSFCLALSTSLSLSRSLFLSCRCSIM